jgi:hypothetical protein
MPVYTLGVIDPIGYRIRYNGFSVGVCALRQFGRNESRWHWTIYIDGTYAKRPVAGVPTAGDADTLKAAKIAFARSFNKMIAAGVARPPSSPQSRGGRREKRSYG